MSGEDSASLATSVALTAVSSSVVALPLLATGQSDLSPGHETVVLWKLAAPADTRSELENPSHLMAGRFDLAFVLVWLFPLFLLALVYDLMAGDREACLAAGMNDYLGKPFSYDAVAEVLRRWLPK